MCEWGNGVMLDLPDGMDTDRKSRTVCVDECIVGQIKALWKAGYETLGCCCGHFKETPSVIIGASYSQEDVEKMAAILEREDDTSWDIMQWQLKTVKGTVGWSVRGKHE